MKRLIDYLLINETVLVTGILKEKDIPPQIGRVVSVIPGGDKVLVEFSDNHRNVYRKDQLLHLYPKPVIMQKLVSNIDIDGNIFKMVLKVFKLISEKRIREALLLAAVNEQVRLLCMTDCIKWQDLEFNYKENRNRKPRH
jgi:hypothetical protein